MGERYATIPIMATAVTTFVQKAATNKSDSNT
jgi:hypothetical protein